MARYRLQPTKEYPARLLAVRQRPIENHDDRVRLLRLEFEIFLETGGHLRSLGKIACCDLVVGTGMVGDAGLLPYAHALAIDANAPIAEWLAAGERALWVSILFGDANPEDERNRFREIHAFDPSANGTMVVEYDVRLGKDWVTPKAAADELDCSAATIRRRVDKYKAEWGSQLVRVTPGGHRKINLSLLKDLEATGHVDSLRIIELRRMRELRDENLFLRREIVNKTREIHAMHKLILRHKKRFSD